MANAHTGLKSNGRDRLYFWFFISPWVIGFLCLTVGPLIFSIFMSFSSWDIFNPPSFIGVKNYIDLVAKDAIFRKALSNTLFYALLSVSLGMSVSIILSYFLDKPVRGRNVFRILIFLPSVIPLVAAAQLFQRVLSPNGLLNTILMMVGIQGPQWLLDPKSVLWALVVMSLWNVGGSTILVLAGMQGIPPTLVEAALIDGASRPRIFRHIILPLLSPVLFFNTIMALIGGLQTFGQVYVITKGTMGPDNSSMLIVPYLYLNAFRDYRMGYASAIAWILFALIMLLSLIVFRSSSIWVFYESEVKR